MSMEVDNREVKVSYADASQKPVIENLIQLYLYDMASVSAFPVNEQGRYDYDFLDRFWEHPYLIYLGGQIAGFSLVISGCPIRERTPCWFMAEFCVLRPYQRQGVGRSAFQSILTKHPGEWEIAWLKDNLTASSFWRASIPETSQLPEKIEFDGAEWASVSFDTGSAQNGQTH